MRILVIDEEFPWPLNTGKRIRTYNLVRELARYNEVAYLAYGEPQSEAVQHLQKVGMNPVAVSPRNRPQAGLGFYLRLLTNLFSPLPYIVTSHFTRRFENQLHRLLTGSAYDLIICEWTPYALYVRNVTGLKKVIVAHNIESAIWRRYEANETNPLKRWYISVQRGKVERFEATCFGWVDGATAVSQLEATAISELAPGLSVTVIDNGVDTAYFTPQPATGAESLVFTGAMDWRPNQDAAHYFMSDIWPLLRQRRPKLQVYFVGRDPSPSVSELGKQDGVHITGTVEDVRPYIAEASVYIVPLRIGGGSRLKILEALAMKKAVVSTSVGAEGLKVIAGQHLLVADSPAEFAEAVDRCLQDRSLRTCLGETGRKLVEEQYRWEQLGKRYHECLTAIARS